MDNIKISIEEAARISDILLEFEKIPFGQRPELEGGDPALRALRASLYKKIAQAQKKAGKRRSESAELAALIKSNQEKIVR